MGFRLTTLLVWVLLWLHAPSLGQQRPAIGLTLSGGGAKGLAHIGILQAIDSAGLQIDYVTGTSMGSIIGGLYAMGYSGDSIAGIVKSLDWGVVLSNKPTLHKVAVEEKPEFGVYAAEVPFVDGKPQFVPGVLEGEELWLTLSKYFMPVHNVKDFSKFKRGFRCIGADIETGDAVVMDHGEIVTALRGSMAIPSVFTPIQYEGKTVVDGGIVRNFPVSDVIEMGAGYVIGVNVGQGLHKAEDLKSAIDVLYQISFYRDAKDFELQKQRCNNFVQVDMPGFSAASFGSADSILKVGQETGRQWYPIFKALADSLNAIYGKPVPKQISYTLTDTLLVNEISYEGLSRTNTRSIETRMGLEANTYYSADEINDAVRSAFGTRNYYKIGYEFQTQPDGKTKLRIHASENSGVFLKAALHFNSFTGGALVLNTTFKNKLFPRSRFIAKVNLGKDPKLKVSYHKFFGKKDDYGFSASANYEGYTIPLYDDEYKQNAEYRYKEWWFDAALHKYFRSTIVYAGYTILAPRIIPKITDLVTLEGTNRYMNLKAGIYHNSLDKQNFATSGWFIKAEGEYYFHQRPDVTVSYAGQPLELDESAFDFDSYERIFIKTYNYAGLSPRSVLITAYHLGVQFDYKESFLNQFVVGGLTDFLRYQMPFAGLDHATVNTESIGIFQAGWQYRIAGNLYSTLRANAALYDFNDVKEIGQITADRNMLSGYALTAGYDSPIGPLELSVMYSDQTKKLMGYLNIGFHF